MSLKAPAALGRRELPVGVGAAVFSQAAAAPDHVVRPELVDNVETAPIDDFVDEAPDDGDVGFGGRLGAQGVLAFPWVGVWPPHWQ
ncbi:hypothetical protein [Streptomyces poonensis]|uniref:Uncharacterized protein n=1 Tax=Streptomyces poonensis TaxID=68255 RepID=A0A918QDY7_9ACTN|nr:hypothetical protein [Streptomyces poonensis]GGZ41493.1 hypothetical protein GCM10010365_72760 [Streptomyces poonensis]